MFYYNINFLLKMFLSTNQNSDIMYKHVEVFSGHSQKQLEFFRLFEKQLTGNKNHKNHQQILDVLELGIKQSELYVEWSEKILLEIKERGIK